MGSLEDIPDAVRRTAEDPYTHARPSFGFEVIRTDRMTVAFGPGPPFNAVENLRLDEDDVEAAVSEVREMLRERGRPSALWSVGPSSRPADMVDRLLALGVEHADEPPSERRGTALAIVEPPPVGAPDVVVRTAETLADYRQGAEIAIRAFAVTDDEMADALRTASETSYEHWRAGAPSAFYLAELDDRCVAFGSSMLMDSAVYLGGGATLPEARGRGVYRAVVRARWDGAVAAGTPALVVQAGSESEPILSRLGFVTVGEISYLIQRV
jgi:hypothetical protein